MSRYFFAVLFVTNTAFAADEPKGTFIELTSLKLLRDKGVITEAEYESAVRDMRETMGLRADEQPTLVLSKWSTTLYGHVKGDFIFDSTESFDEVAGNRNVAYPLLYAANKPRLQFSIRDSRWGLRIRAPEWHSIRTSGQIEFDFFGTQLPIGQASGTTPYFQSESATFSSPSVRVRHAYFRIENPIVDVLVGQYWSPIGFQPNYFPCSVQALGIAGMLYSRVPQLRLSKTLDTKPVTVEIMAAAVRPAQRDSGIPVLQWGGRLAINGWKGIQTQGSSGTAIMPASIAVSGDYRRLALTEFAATPVNSIDLDGGGIAVDAFLPILPAKERKGNALSISGEFVYGRGLADMYTSLTGGLSLPENYPPNIDPGIATYDGNMPAGAHTVRWLTWTGSIQYYLPGLAGRAWIAATYANAKSDNIGSAGFIGALPTTTVDRKDLFDASMFGDITPHVRLGVGYAYQEDRYLPTAAGVAVSSVNHRVQATGLLMF